MTIESEGTLAVGEVHPMAHSAMQYVEAHLTPLLVESIASTALSGNRTAEVCLGTINRLHAGEPVSDRYILGLAWFLLQMDGEE